MQNNNNYANKMPGLLGFSREKEIGARGPMDRQIPVKNITFPQLRLRGEGGRGNKINKI